MKTLLTFRLNGFTIMEMIVTMILSVLLVGTLYWIYFYAQKQLLTSHEKHKNVSSLILFKDALKRDFQKCRYIIFMDKHTYYFVYNSDTVIYNLHNTAKIKRAGIIDSFNVTISNIAPVNIDLVNGEKVVKYITFSILSPVEIPDIVFTKYYSSEQLINISN